MKTTLSTTIGVSAREPTCERLLAAFPVSMKPQANFSDDTFFEEMVEPMATRVFARLPFGNAHDGDAGLAPAAELTPPLAANKAMIVASTREVTTRRTVALLIFHPFGFREVVLMQVISSRRHA